MSSRTAPLGLGHVASGLLAACLTLAACGDGPKDDAARFHQPTATVVFGSATESIELEVDYAKGAEPKAGIVPGVGADAWTLFGTNAKRIFSKASPKTLTVPATLGEMEALDITGDSFTEDEILSIADAHRSKRSAGSLATFYAVWLPGYFNDGHGPKKDVLGVTIGATGVIAMFKGAIESTSGGGAFQAALLEQFTLLHEFGHAVGLVDNGISPASAHRDTSHGAHCTNPACAMYFANEGVAAALNFARQITVGDEILLGPECLEDIDNFAASR
jgi:predicted Zn-dependent protease